MKIWLTVLLSLLLYGGPALAAGAPVWVEAVGESQGSDFDPPREVLERARSDAKRKAIEQAVGSFVRSHTLVMNAQLADDMTFARARGKIDQVEIISEERDQKEPGLYRVKLRALVTPVYPSEDEGLHVKLSLSKTALKPGDEVKIYYQANADCYVYIFSIGADNSVTLLLPNSLVTDNFLQAQAGRVYPPDGSPIRLRAMPLPEFKDKLSEEKVKVIATRRKEILLTGFQEGIYKVYGADSTGLVGDLARKLNQLDPAEWGEAMISYTVEQ